jgi:mono/diheme cytochrome c family protein
MLAMESTGVVRMAAVLLCGLAVGCQDLGPEPEQSTSVAPSAAIVDSRSVAAGREIFRHDDFGDWRFWTDTLRLDELVATVSPVAALGLGLKVDSEAVPPAVLQAVLANAGALNDPATTVALLGLDAVVGLAATVVDGEITRIGITCALCHSTVDDAVTAGIGRRLDGWPNADLQVGTIISLTPGLPTELATVYASWPAGFYDARFNFDGINDPTVIPPAYGLRGVGLETYTGEGPISYWNSYVAVTQMHGQGSFSDPRLGVSIRVPAREDLVTSKLPALRAYQHTLQAPPSPEAVDPVAAARGRELFAGEARCASCHVGPNLTDGGRLHAPEETNMDPTHADRGTTGKYRTTPLRGLWQHPPYFHDGSAETLEAVVEHYAGALDLDLTDGERADLVAYLSSL